MTSALYKRDEIINDIIHHFEKWNGKIEDLFVGLTENPQEALFNRQVVDKDAGIWIYRRAKNNEEANYAFNDLLKKGFHKVSEKPSKGRFIYAFKSDNLKK